MEIFNNNNNNLLQNITIIIPTYYRFKFLKRILNFYFLYNTDMHILIVDSTPNNLQKDNELLKLLKKNNVSYFQYDENTQFSNKIYNGLKNVKTKYAVLCADDDFLIPHGLKECIKFLEINDDYSSSQGFYFNHFLASESSFFMSNLYHLSKSLKKDTARERFLDGFVYNKQGINPHYAVHRTKELLFIWKETTKFAIGSGYTEFFPCALSFIYGKMKLLPYFYGSREKNSLIWYTDDQYVRMHSEYNTNKVIEGITKHLSIVDNISLKEAYNFFDNYSFDPRPDILKNKPKNKILNYYSFYNKIINFFFNKIIYRLSIKYILNYFFNIAKGCPIKIYPKGFNDYNKIKLSVISANCLIEDLNVFKIIN